MWNGLTCRFELPGSIRPGMDSWRAMRDQPGPKARNEWLLWLTAITGEWPLRVASRRCIRDRREDWAPVAREKVDGPRTSDTARWASSSDSATRFAWCLCCRTASAGRVVRDQPSWRPGQLGATLGNLATGHSPTISTKRRT